MRIKMQDLIREALGKSPFLIKDSNEIKITPISGGCINNAWKIDLDKNKAIFAKTNTLNNYKLLKFESESLLLLKKFANDLFIHIPKPIKLCSVKKLSILFLPWIEFVQEDQYRLGKGLALLHKCSSQNQYKFGWEKDGFIGTNSQIRGMSTKWGEYFVNFRLLPQIRLASKWGLEVDNYKTLLSQISNILNHHNPEPSLVHGDLWGGNKGTLKDGKGCIFDPASYWADREVDLAMTRLFGGFSDEFYRGYEEKWPLSKDANLREDIYNLYHILNHSNLFGGGYHKQTLQTIKKIEGSI